MDMTIYAPKTRSARLRRTVVLSVLIVAGAVFGPQAFATEPSSQPVQLDTYTVGSGETLWSIAANLTPEGRDVRETMADIQQINALSSSQLQAGEQILLPRSP
jgi:LysM repeat protein